MTAIHASTTGPGVRLHAVAAWLVAMLLVLAPWPVRASSLPSDVLRGAHWVHGYAAFGEPKYPRGFDHFDYVNPDAPKGGTLRLANPDRRNSFDKFNPFTIKGQSPAGLTTLMFETMAVRSGDEPMTMYGLLAEDMAVAPDKSWIAFRLNPKARFTNGDPVLAGDVKQAFDLLTSKAAAPAVRTNLAGVRSATVVDARTIVFEMAEKSNDALFNVGTMPVFSHKWGLGADGTRKPFDQIITEYPITSGPYTIEHTDSGRRIDFLLDRNYWARDLGVSKGQYNFERVIYRYYQDEAISMEAFKAGEFDFLVEYSARRWVRAHAGPKWSDGRIIKQTFPTGFGMGLQSYVINLRRPMFQDRRVREALNYTYDFTVVNVYKQYQRTESMFANTEFAASGLPSPGELALLEPFRAQLPPEVFGPAWKAPRFDTSPNALRENLKKARALLEQAGWKLDSAGVLRNAAGEPFVFEYLRTGDAASATEIAWQHNLEKLGIRLKLRLVDFALFRKRLEVFDFDVVMIKLSDFTIPSAADLRDLYGSKNADTEGSGNFRGLKSPAVDALIDRIDKAQTLDELRDAARALDRVIMFGYYQIPDLYLGAERVSRWDKFGMPKTLPKYFTIATPSDWLQWGITAWWSKDAERKSPAPAGTQARADTAR
jgi:peptide/nickel transport system substrate-binding protein/microcin C transport system substrate-binding protein